MIWFVYLQINKMRSSQEMNLAQCYEDPDDPFSREGDHLLYIGSHKITIYICQKPEISQKLPNQQELILKIILIGQIDNPKMLKMQLSSDSELYFNFHFSCNQIQFRRIREIQKFFIQYRQYPQAIIKNLQKLKNPSSNYEASFLIFSQTEGKLQLIRKSEFKNDKIMEFDFVKSSDEHIKASIQHRYDLMRKQYLQNQQKHEEFRQIIRSKNPSLMMQIDKSMKGKK